jgi:hypothetical protein
VAHRKGAASDAERTAVEGRKVPAFGKRKPSSLNAKSYQVSDGRACLGFVLSRGRAGFEAFDCEERSLGLYPAAPAAANAVCAAAENERAAS